MQRRGFTLIELLISIAIIGILSSVVLVNVQQARVKAKETTYKQELTQLRSALELYYAENGRYPRPNDSCDDNMGDAPGWSKSDCGTQPFITGLTQFTDFSWLKAPDRIFYTSRGSVGTPAFAASGRDEYQSYKLFIQRDTGGERVLRTNSFTYCPVHCTTGYCATEYSNGTGIISYWENRTFTISNGFATCAY